MRGLLLLFFVFLFVGEGVGQNLVSNGSFEDYSQCPIYANQVPYAIGWENFLLTPDYYNSCTSNPDISVPQNITGYQLAATGNAYCGFLGYAFFFPPYHNVREHIAQELDFPLVIGKRYFFSMKVSLAFNNANASCASNKIGVKFSTISYENYALNSTTSPLINDFAHVYTDSIITDSINWTTINGSFIADSAYKYMVIGNFFDDANTSTLFISSPDSICSVYYYLDDIELVEDTAAINIKLIRELEQDIKIYAADRKIFIQSFASKIVDIQIYNTLGQIINQGLLFPHDNSIIDLSGQANGVYLICTRINQAVITKKIFLTD